MGASEGKRKVLVVEDASDIRTMLRVWLEGSGYEVVEAADGQEAVEVARRECPDLVLMDISLPKLDGLTAARTIRRIEELCDVPVVACSAHVGWEWRRRARQAGCVAFVEKPMELAELDAIIKGLLARDSGLAV
jgi:CheY-like chemotaxis protein